MRRSPWMLVFVLLLATQVSAGDHELTFTLPLDHGRLCVRDVLAKAAEHIGGLPAGLAVLAESRNSPALDWSIDVQSLRGRMEVKALERALSSAAGGLVNVDITSDHVTLRIEQPPVTAPQPNSKFSLARWLNDFMKFEPQRDMTRFGLTFVTATNARAAAADLSPAMRQRVVIVVHGLDDPGVMWTDLVPALHAGGYTVGRFEYPDDGPISESADLLAQCLRDAKIAGIERVDVVAHSMGGLVVRDTLTRAAYYAGDGSGERSGGKYPAVDRLIMLGPPNHGAGLARFRGIAELREHLMPAIMSGRSLRELGMADGNGEAGMDLMPGSDFLRRVNARPLPTHTQCTIVAAQWVNVNGRTLAWIFGRARAFASSSSGPATRWLQQSGRSSVADIVEREAVDAIDGLGDGCVSVASAKLDGVNDFVLVHANHLGMILNVGGTRRATPPAIPIVLDRLSRPLPQ